MNITPKTVARQIVLARAERAAKPVFTSQTGVVRPVHVSKVEVFEEDDSHCFICSRHTSHFAEHDDMVEAGLAFYSEDGSTHWTEKGWAIEMGKFL